MEKKKDFWLAFGDTLCEHGLLMGANGDFKFMFMNKQCGCLPWWVVSTHSLRDIFKNDVCQPGGGKHNEAKLCFSGNSCNVWV